MAANVPVTQVLYEDGKTALVKIDAYYTAANTFNAKVVTANTLAFANASQTCLFTINRIQYSVDAATGFFQLQWIGASSNQQIMTFGTSNDGNFETYIPNNATSPTGDLNLMTSGVANNDCITLILTLTKETGYSNAYIGYNDTSYKP
jgi:hypothetical protein